MKHLSIAFAVIALGLVAQAQDKSKDLPEELKLRVQVQQQAEQIHQLEIASAQCSAQLADAQAKLASSFLTAQQGDLKAKREAIEKDLLKALGAKEGDTIDWTTTPPSLKKKS